MAFAGDRITCACLDNLWMVEGKERIHRPPIHSIGIDFSSFLFCVFFCDLVKIFNKSVFLFLFLEDSSIFFLILQCSQYFTANTRHFVIVVDTLRKIIQKYLLIQIDNLLKDDC